MAAALFLSSCGSAPPVTTSTGIVVPASTVVAQDTVADVLKVWKDAHNKAVQIHDSLVAVDAPDVHAAHRKILLDDETALHAAYKSLEAWKAISTDAPVTEILSPLWGGAKAFLALAEQIGALSPADAARIRRVLP